MLPFFCGRGQTLKKKNALREKTFDISELFIECNTDSCCEHITGGINIYLYGCVSPLRVLCVFVCVISNQSNGKEHIKCQTSVTLKACCIKHIKVLLALKC